MPATATVNQSSDPYVNGVLGSARWASGNLSFSFPILVASYEVPYGSNEPLTNFASLSGTQQNAARAALANYAAVANFSFSEVGTAAAGTATLRIAMSDKPGTAWAYFPTTAPEGGDVWFNRSGGYYNNPQAGNYAYATFLHEIGHALGLKHPHETTAMPADRDFMQYTVMSYRSYAGQSVTQGYVNETWGFAQSLMMYDIAAIQSMYGANFGTNSGNTTYSWSPTTGQMFINGVGQATPGGNKIFSTLWDGGGTDTYDFSNYATNLSVDLRPGNWTTTSAAQLARLSFDGAHIAAGNIANALQFNGDVRSLIENAVGGSGNDTLRGNDAANALRGGGGNDTIDGGGGTDTALYAGTRAQYSFTAVSGGVRVTDQVVNRDGVDLVYQTERFSFSDGVVNAEDLLLADGNAYLFGSSTLAIANFGTAAGNWTSFDRFPRTLADVNGDGRADIVGFGVEGPWSALGQANGTFGAIYLATYGFGTDAGGWVSQDRFPRTLADINGDGRADIAGFGVEGVWAALGQANGTFGSMYFAGPGFGTQAGGWVSQDRYPRTLADINGDGRADIVGFGVEGVYAALGQANGTFGAMYFATPGFGTQAGGWVSQDRYPRTLADINGDGRADIVGFGVEGIYAALGQANGTFGAMYFATPGFGTSAGGWISQDQYPRTLADINGDGRADIVGFGVEGIYAALGQANGTFTGMFFAGPGYGPAAGGWASYNQYPRTLEDVNGDGRADVVGFAANGAYVSLSTAAAAQVPGPTAAAPEEWPAEANHYNDGDESFSRVLQTTTDPEISPDQMPHWLGINSEPFFTV